MIKCGELKMIAEEVVVHYFKAQWNDGTYRGSNRTVLREELLLLQLYKLSDPGLVSWK
jgi:hypothetical protein